jgi:APA family basic amino acid/polyamine antiporter
MVKLKRSIGLLETTAYGVGIILGAGIYALIGDATGFAGNSVWVSFLIGAIVASFTGLSYCELSTMYPKSAAEYIYTKKAFKSNLISFMLGWLIIFTGIISATTVALGFGGYFHGLFNTPIILISILLILALSFLNFYGIKESARLNIVFTAIEALGLIIIIVIGLGSFGKVNYIEFPFGAKGIFSAAALIFFAYIGFDEIVNVAEETKKPRKVLPKAIILAILITTILYILVSISAVSIVGWKELSQSSAPLSLVASKIFGQKAFVILSVIALFATTNTVLIILVAAARMIYGMARDKSLPRILSSIDPRKRTPLVAILAVMILSIVFAFIGDIDFVANVTSLGAFITFAFVNASLIWLRFTKPKFKRSFKVPLNIGKFPVLPFLGLITCVFMISRFHLDTIGIMLGIIASGVIIFYLKRFIE